MVTAVTVTTRGGKTKGSQGKNPWRKGSKSPSDSSFAHTQSIIHVHANSGVPIRELKRKFVTGVIYSNYSNFFPFFPRPAMREMSVQLWRQSSRTAATVLVL